MNTLAYINLFTLLLSPDSPLRPVKSGIIIYLFFIDGDIRKIAL